MVDVKLLDSHVWLKLQLTNESSQIILVSDNVILLLDIHAAEESC